MATSTRAILEFLRDTLLPSVDGSAPYVYDLSAAGAVKVGMPPRDGPEVVPSVYIWTDRCRYEHSGPASLRGYRKRLRVGVAGYVKPTDADGDTRAGRLNAAADLGDDIARAILENHRLDTGSTRLAQSVTLELTSLDGAEANHPSGGIVFGHINITAILEG